MLLILLTCVGVLVTSLRLSEQAPMVTDDTAVAAVRIIHLDGEFQRIGNVPQPTPG